MKHVLPITMLHDVLQQANNKNTIIHHFELVFKRPTVCHHFSEYTNIEATHSYTHLSDICSRTSTDLLFLYPLNYQTNKFL